MIIKEALDYFQATKYKLREGVHCDSCDVYPIKTIYVVPSEAVDLICGKCLIKWAKSHKEYIDNGGWMDWG